jgi:hypothetical protein
VPAGQQQQQQRYAGAGRVIANRSPEQFFRDRADDSNPFWMSAVEGDAVGMLGTTAVLQAPPGRKGSFSMANCELSVVLGPQQLLQVWVWVTLALLLFVTALVPLRNFRKCAGAGKVRVGPPGAARIVAGCTALPSLGR